MYIIINKTQNKTVKMWGNFPDMYEELERGDNLIIISFYSNPIKVPYNYVENGLSYWDYIEYPLPLGNDILTDSNIGVL